MKRLQLIFASAFFSIGIAWSSQAPLAPVAVAEGSAISDSIDILAQARTPGILIISAPPNDDLANDMESSAPCAFRMPAIHEKAESVPHLISRINSLQNMAAFSLNQEKIFVVIPSHNIEVGKLLSVLDRPLGMGADTSVDINILGGTDTSPLEARIVTTAAKFSLRLTAVQFTYDPDCDPNYYEIAQLIPTVDHISLNPETTLRQVLDVAGKGHRELVWVLLLHGSKLTLQATCVRWDRRDRPLASILEEIKPSYSKLDGYPDVRHRIRDASRELQRRLLLDSVPTLLALEKSRAIQDLLMHLSGNNNDISLNCSEALHFLLCYRNVPLTDYVLSLAKSAPKDGYDDFFESVLPDFRVKGPGWKDLYQPIWTSLLTNPNKDIRKRARMAFLPE